MNKKILYIFILLIFLLICLTLISLNLGSIKVTYVELFKGLFLKYDEKVASIYDIRFPRIFLCLLSGASLAVAGVLFQAILKNPIADASILGISSGASLASILAVMVFPTLYAFKPIVAFIGGIITFKIIIILSAGRELNSIKIILIGIALNAVLTGIIEGLSSMNSSIYSIISANVSFKTWSDVRLMFCYALIGLILAFCSFKFCDVLALDEKTARGLGFNTTVIKIVLLFIAVILVSISTAVLGVIYFLGLIIPHISRRLVGTKHVFLIPFSMLLGGFILLLADTVGRTIISPYEISASVIMNILGGITFLVLLRKCYKIYGN